MILTIALTAACLLWLGLLACAFYLDTTSPWDGDEPLNTRERIGL